MIKHIYQTQNNVHALAISADQFALYTANFGASGSINGFSLNQITGELSGISGSPWDADGSDTHAIALTALFVYVVNFSSGHVAGFTRDPSTGVLTEIAGSPWACGAQPHCVCVERTGKFLYTANAGDANIAGFSIAQDTGALTELSWSPLALPNTEPWWLYASPVGNVLYLANFVGQHQDTDWGGKSFSVDPDTGALTLAATRLGKDTQRGVVVTPDGQYVYYVSASPAGIYGFKADTATGELTQLPASPFAYPSTAGFPPMITPDGKFFLVPCNDIGAVSVHAIDASDGTLVQTASSPFPCGYEPQSIAISDDGRFVYIGCSNAQIAAFSMAQSSGILSLLGAYPHLGGEAWGATMTPQTSTLAVQSASLREYTLSQSQYPTYKITLGYDFLTQDDQDELLGFLLYHLTSGTPFLRVLQNRRYQPLLSKFAVADGVTATYRLMRQVGQFREPVAATFGYCTAGIGGVGDDDDAVFSGDGTVTYSTVPPANSWLYWSGYYAFLCRADTAPSIEEVLNRLYTSQEVDLITILP